MRLLVFGDSITEGFYDDEKGGWVNRLKIQLWKKDIDVVNCGISAYTTKHILNMFQSFFSAYYKRESGKEKETIVIFLIGTNDSFSKNKKLCVSHEDFKKNLQKLCNLCSQEKYIKNVYFTTCVNCDESKTTPVSWEDIYYRNSEIQNYNNIIKEVCDQNTLECIDLYGLLDNSDFSDGLHPNKKGHEKIFSKVYSFLEM